MARKKFISKTDKMFYKLDREIIWQNQKEKCYYCSKKLKRNEITLDHVVPLSKLKYRHAPSNCVVACFSCNQKKSNRTDYRPQKEQWEILLQDGLERLEKQTRKSVYRIVRYSGCEDHKGSFAKWEKYWEKKGRFG
jgi:5-methylcytosine-specific restriction endonuclease McrA